MTLQTETPMGLPEYVYEAPVRLWHWINAACILVLAVTGYLIGSPLEIGRAHV